MEQIKEAISKFISVPIEDLNDFISGYHVETFKKKTFLFKAGQISEKVYFVNKGLVREFIETPDGNECTCFFASEGMFIADYSSFLSNQPGHYSLQALEDTEVVVMPKSEIEQSYSESLEANMLGRKVAEHYFMYFDSRLKDMYMKAPVQRYNELTEMFPDIHNRAPQHMLASLLNISPVHLSRLRSQK